MLAGVVAIVVASSAPAVAHAGLPTAPAALPQLWGVEVDGRTLKALDRPVLVRLRAARATLVAAPRLSARQRRRLAQRARKAGLRAMRPLEAGTAPAGALACLALERRRPGTRCGVRAPSASVARKLAGGRAADLVVLRTGRVRSLGKLESLAGSGRLVAVARLSLKRWTAARWRRALAAARRSSKLDLVVRPTGPRARAALSRATALATRFAGRDRTSPAAPRALRVAGAAADTAQLRWRRPRSAVRFGIYKDGVRVRATRRLSSVVGQLGCSGHVVEVDAVDRAGNRSRKRPLQVSAAGCIGPADRAASDPAAGAWWLPAEPPGYDVPATAFVAPGASETASCTRDDPCGSLMRAYELSPPGTVIDVAGGSYGPQRLVAVAGKADPPVVLRPAQGERVILGGLNIDGADHVAVTGMELVVKPAEPGAGNQRGIFVGPGSSFVQLERMDAGSVETWMADHILVRGGDYGPCDAVWGASNVCSNNKLDVSSNVTVYGARFHDMRFDESCFGPGGDCHWECMYVNGGRNITIQNSAFRNCAIFDIFATVSGPDAAALGHDGLTIENNWFGTPWTEDAGGGSPARGTALALAWCGSSPHGYQNVRIAFNSFQSNTGLFVDRVPECLFRNVQVIGNLMMRGTCDRDFAYAYNAYSTASSGSTCSSTDRIAGPAFPYADPAADFHLAGPSVADGLVPVGAGCPILDIDGQRRPTTGACDGGADER
jgi:hypothetical protein